jgi:hypothetical protein
MATPVFKRIDNADGTFTYEEVKDATELPEELVKANPLYKGVLDETIQRRKTINDLKAKITTVVSDEKPEDEKPVVKAVETPSVQPLDEDALFAKFRERILAETTVETKAERQAREQKEAAVNQAMEANGLSSPELRKVIAESANPAETAKLLAKSGYRFDDVSAGEVPSVKSTEVSGILDNFKKKYAGKNE